MFRASHQRDRVGLIIAIVAMVIAMLSPTHAAGQHVPHHPTASVHVLAAVPGNAPIHGSHHTSTHDHASESTSHLAPMSGRMFKGPSSWPATATVARVFGLIRLPEQPPKA